MTTKSLEERIRRLEENEKKYQVIEDIEKIRQLHYRYLNSYTFGNRDETVACFSDNAIAQVGPSVVEGRPEARGKAEITKLYKEILVGQNGKKPDSFYEGHVCVHPIITVEGDKAKADWVIYIMHSHPRFFTSLFWIQAVYDAEYIKENGQWKISYLKLTRRLGPPGGPPWEERDYENL
jgi:hypothetical protein